MQDHSELMLSEGSTEAYPNFIAFELKKLILEKNINRQRNWTWLYCNDSSARIADWARLVLIQAMQDNRSPFA